MNVWKRDKRVYRIAFDSNHELYGLEFKVVGMTIAEYLKLDKSDDALLVREFFNRVLSTNAASSDDSDKAMDPVVAQMMNLDADVVLTAAVNWLRQVANPIRGSAAATSQISNVEDTDPLQGMQMSPPA